MNRYCPDMRGGLTIDARCQLKLLYLICEEVWLLMPAASCRPSQLKLLYLICEEVWLLMPAASCRPSQLKARVEQPRPPDSSSTLRVLGIYKKNI